MNVNRIDIVIIKNLLDTSGLIIFKQKNSTIVFASILN